MKKFKFKKYVLYLNVGSYASNGRLAVTCKTKEESFCDITINLPDGFCSFIDEAFIDSMCKDCGLYQELIDKGIIKEVIRKNVTYNMGHYDLVRFDLDKLKGYDPNGYKYYLDTIGFEEKISRTPKI